MEAPYPGETKLKGVVAGITAQTPKHSSCAVTTMKAAGFLGQILLHRAAYKMKLDSLF